MTPGGSMSTNYMRTLVEDLLFFSGDVQTTTIAIAITSSLCCSIVWLVVSLVNGDHATLLTLLLETWKSRSGSPAQDAVESLHLSRRSSGRCAQFDKEDGQPNRSIWTDRETDGEISVPCICCGFRAANRFCRFILCTFCCRDNRSTLCVHHTNRSLMKQTYTHRLDIPKEIDLSYLNLKRCPDRVGFTGSQLVTLNLSYNRLKRVPEELGCLLGLQQLHLQYNCLKTLPESLGSLEQLLELDLRGNRLYELPKSLGNLTCLTSLKVNSNNLSALPSSLGQLVSLRALFAECNQLRELPRSISNLSKLKCLYLSQNPLEQLPETMGKLVRLEQLDVASCNLTSVTPSLFWCTALRQLWLSHNMLSFLPDQFGRLHRLEELHVKANALHYLPASLACIQLYTLNCSHNPLLEESDLDLQQRIAPEVVPSSDIPPLLELAARCIVRAGISWRHQNLPHVLKLMLENARYCSCCEGPLFDYFQSQFTFRPLVGLTQALPLFQQICTLHSPLRCQLRPID